MGYSTHLKFPFTIIFQGGGAGWPAVTLEWDSFPVSFGLLWVAIATVWLLVEEEYDFSLPGL